MAPLSGASFTLFDSPPRAMRNAPRVGDQARGGGSSGAYVGPMGSAAAGCDRTAGVATSAKASDTALGAEVPVAQVFIDAQPPGDHGMRHDEPVMSHAPAGPAGGALVRPAIICIACARESMVAPCSYVIALTWSVVLAAA